MYRSLRQMGNYVVVVSASLNDATRDQNNNANGRHKVVKIMIWSVRTDVVGVVDVRERELDTHTHAYIRTVRVQAQPDKV